MAEIIHDPGPVTRRWLGTPAAVLGAVLIVAALVVNHLLSRGDADDRELVISISDDDADFNPFSPNFSRVGRFVSGPLLRVDSRGRLHPGVADSLAPEADGRSWLVALRKGAAFTDGNAIAAEDVAASINAYADKKVGSRYSGVLASGQFRHAKVVDAGHVRVTFGQPWVPARMYLAQLGVWPKTLVDRVQADPANVSVKATELVGAGPYRIQSYEAKSGAVLTPVGEGEVIRVRIQDEDAAFSSFREGTVHLTYAEPRRQPQFAAVPGAKVMPYLYHEGISLAVNCRAGTVTQRYPELRRAVLMEVDPEVMRNLVAKSGSQPARSNLFAGAQAAFNAPDAAKHAAGHDPAAANKLLDARGFAVKDGYRTTPDGAALELTVLSYSSITEYPALVKRIAADLEATLKIRTRVVLLPSSDFERVMYLRNKAVSWDLLIAEWPFHDEFEPSLADAVARASIPDPSRGTTGRNHIGLSDERLNALALQADRTLDEAARRRVFHDLHRRLLQLDAVKPLYFVEDSWVVSPRVEGHAADDPFIRVTIFGWPERFRLKKQ